VVEDGQQLANGATGYSNPTMPATVSMVRPVHRSSQAAAINQCWVRATSLVKSTGWARAYGQNTCTSAVTWQQLFVTLREYWTSINQWRDMDTGAAGPTSGGKTIRAHAEMPCKSSAVRAWHDQAVGYDELQGVLYTGTNNLYKNLTCRG
jgi:hypothetical protein